jgi:inner membrane protein
MSDQLPANTEFRKPSKFSRITSSGGFKIVMLIILVLLLLIPVSMISSLIRERYYRSREVEGSIMEAWGSQFTLYGPVIRHSSCSI